MSKHTARHLANAVWHLKLAVKSAPPIDANANEVQAVLAAAQYVAARYPPPTGSVHGRGDPGTRSPLVRHADDSEGAQSFGLD